MREWGIGDLEWERGGERKLIYLRHRKMSKHQISVYKLKVEFTYFYCLILTEIFPSVLET